MSSFRLTCVTSTGSPARAQRLGLDRVAMVLGADRDLAGREVLAGLIAAVVAELELLRRAAEREAEDLVAEADAEHRVLARRARAPARARPRRRPGRPGRSRGRPRRAASERTCSAVVRAGTTVTSKPWSTSRRRMLRFTPKSYATTLSGGLGRFARGSWPSTPCQPPSFQRYGAAQVTPATRSTPSSTGALRARSTSSSAPWCAGSVLSDARLEARSRMRRTSARVSMPAMRRNAVPREERRQRLARAPVRGRLEHLLHHEAATGTGAPTRRPRGSRRRFRSACRSSPRSDRRTTDRSGSPGSPSCWC